MQAVVSWICAMLLVVCSISAYAAKQDSVKVPLAPPKEVKAANLVMKCKLVASYSEQMGVSIRRCENDEVICYSNGGTSDLRNGGGITCKFKSSQEVN